MKHFILYLILGMMAMSFSFVTAEQCKGTTAAGIQCSRNAPAGKEYCFQHDPAALKCGAKTSTGNPCKMTVKAAGEKCHHHQPHTPAPPEKPKE